MDGKQVWPKQPQARSSNGKYKSRKWIKRIMAVLVVGLVGVGIYGSHWSSQNMVAVNPPVVYAGVTMEAKVDALKADIRSKVRDCERAGHDESDSMITFDTGGQASLGTYQFYRPTIIRYMDIFHGDKMTMKQAADIAWDDAKAGNLFDEIVYKDDTDWVKETGGIFNWKNCAHKSGVIPQIKVIRQLEA